jgi:tetratricopeptide (TPR) repeat protein
VPYQLAGRSAYFARTRERFLRAELLERAGRLVEAYDWYSAAPHGARLDYLYLAPSHLGRGRIRERQGNAAAAAEHYRKVLALMPAPDPELAALRRDAAAGLARSTRR